MTTSDPSSVAELKAEEWTKQTVHKLSRAVVTWDACQKIADAHNTSLAASRQREEKLREALERAKKMIGIMGHHYAAAFPSPGIEQQAIDEALAQPTPAAPGEPNDKKPE